MYTEYMISNKMPPLDAVIIPKLTIQTNQIFFFEIIGPIAVVN